MNPILFALLAVAFVSGVMIVLQAVIRKGVWSGYLLLFFASVIGAAAVELL